MLITDERRRKRDERAKGEIDEKRQREEIRTDEMK